MPADRKNIIYTEYNGHIAQLQGDFEARARTEAAQHQPPTGRTTFDSHEAELLAEADRCCAGEQRMFEGKLTDPARQVSDARARLTALKSMADPQSVITQLDGELEQVFAKGKGLQEDLTEGRMRREVDLRHFCHINRITSPATYPLSKWRHASWVVVSIFIESIANSVFYTNDNGLLGGFVVAFSVSLINIGVAFFLGVGFRYKNLADRTSRTIGWAALTGFVALTLFCNALFASFRSEYQLVTDTSNGPAMRLAFTHAMNQASRIFILQTSLSDFMSFVLFGIGIMLSCFAFYKGYSSDDRFPGYGDKDRRYREELEAERTHTDGLRNQAAAAITQQRAIATRLAQEPRELVGLCAKKKGEVDLACRGAEYQFRAVRRDFQQVISAYRNMNRAIRQNEPPTYWNTAPEPSILYDDSGARTILSDLEALERDLNQLVATAAEHSQAMIRTLGEHSKDFMERRFPTWLEGCAAEARERLNRSTPGAHQIGMIK